MDDGGEVRLARKKGKRKVAPSAAAREAEGGEASSSSRGRGRGRDRFQSLWRDYHDLLQETEAKKRRLESMNRRNLGLLAQVKFLRKKYSSFVKDDPQQTHHRLKHKKARQIPSPLGSNSASVFAYPGETGEGPSTSKNTNLDLNQDSAMDDESADCQGYQNHSDVDELNQTGVNEDMMPTDVNLPVCRDTGNQPVMLRGQ